nr:uncharacterized protein LOC117278374 [Nicotiana tomentosiformis]
MVHFMAFDKDKIIIASLLFCNLEAKKVRGPTLLKDIWKLPSGKTIDVPFNNRNQAIGKEGRKIASFLGIISRTPELAPLHVDDWRNFDNEEKKKLVDFVRKMINERMSNSERSTEQPPCSVAWEGDVYSQVLQSDVR